VERVRVPSEVAGAARRFQPFGLVVEVKIEVSIRRLQVFVAVLFNILNNGRAEVALVLILNPIVSGVSLTTTPSFHIPL